MKTLSKNERIIQLLEENRSLLWEIKAILTLANHDKLEEMKKRLLKEGSIKKQIYDLCDGTRTTSDIAQTIGKDNPYVNSYLSILRREGLVGSIIREGRQVHEQIF